MAQRQYTEYPHGTLSRYTKGKCRCDECRAANTAYHRNWRAENHSRSLEYGRKHIAANRAVMVERTRVWRELNPDASRAISARWRAGNLEQARAKSRAWNAAHPDIVKVANQAWRGRNRAQEIIRSAEWRKANPERWKAATARWQAANRDKVRLTAERRRARKKSVESLNVKVGDWVRLSRRYGCCAYCGSTSRPLTQDHVIPLARGGRHAIGNLLPACQPCNSSKGAKLLIEWGGRPGR